MKRPRLSLTVFLLLCVLCFAQPAYYYPQLPEKVASHFGFSGSPDAWSTRTFFVAFYYVITAIIVLLFLCISFGLSKIPVSLINLPNKAYWLSEERRRETFDFMFHYFLWFASATLLLLIDVFNQSVQVHLGKADSLSHPILSLGCYVGFTIMWGIALIMKFGKFGE